MNLELKNEIIEIVDERIDTKLDRKFGQFAILMQNSFAHIESRFDRIELKLDKHDNRLSSLESRMSSIESKSEGHSRRFDYIDDNIRLIKIKLEI